MTWGFHTRQSSMSIYCYGSTDTSLLTTELLDKYFISTYLNIWISIMLQPPYQVTKTLLSLRNELSISHDLSTSYYLQFRNYLQGLLHHCNSSYNQGLEASLLLYKYHVLLHPFHSILNSLAYFLERWSHLFCRSFLCSPSEGYL